MREHDDREVFVPGVGCAWVADDPDAYMGLWMAKQMTSYSENQKEIARFYAVWRWERLLASYERLCTRWIPYSGALPPFARQVKGL